MRGKRLNRRGLFLIAGLLVVALVAVIVLVLQDGEDSLAGTASSCTDQYNVYNSAEAAYQAAETAYQNALAAGCPLNSGTTSTQASRCNSKLMRLQSIRDEALIKRDNAYTAYQTCTNSGNGGRNRM